MKKLSVLLALVLVIACLFTGCSIKKDIVGTWEATLDLSEQINKVMSGEVGDAQEYYEIKDFKMKIVLTFKDDNTVELKVDETVLENSMDSMVDQMVDGMKAYLEDGIKDAGLDMTLDEYLDAIDMSMEDIEKEIRDGVGELSIDDIIESKTATYTIDDNKVIVNSVEDGEEVTETYEYVEGKLYLRDASNVDDESKELFDMLKAVAIEKVQ